MLPDMLLPSTINEVILSMSDVESREKLYDAGLQLKNFDVLLHETSPCRGKQSSSSIVPAGYRKFRKKSEEKKQDVENEKMKVVDVCLVNEKDGEPLLPGVHRQRALDNGHFRKDRHRSFRMEMYTKRSRTMTF